MTDRTCLPVPLWPAIDRELWEQALNDDDLLGDGGLASKWRPDTVRKVSKSYGRFLTYLNSEGLLDEASEPSDRITRDNIANYVELLRTQVASKTLAGRIIDLGEAIRVMCPDADIAWLQQCAARLSRQIVPDRIKHPRLVSSDRLFALGISLMERSRIEVGPRPVSSAVLFRDGLMISLLAARPFRLRTFWRLSLGLNLRSSGSGYLIEIRNQDTKTGRGDTYPLTDRLAPWMDDYLKRVRPALLKDRQSDKLWISWQGDDLSECGIHEKIEKRTREAFGHAINPHLFRDCAATTIAVEDPEHVRIIKSILGHASLETGERYYNQAQSLTAQGLLRSSLLARRKSLGETSRRSPSR